MKVQAEICSCCVQVTPSHPHIQMAEEEGVSVAGSSAHVVFPHDQPQWPKVKPALMQLTQPSQDLDTALDKLCRLWAAHRSSKRSVLPIDKTPFPGLKAFFQKYSKPEEIELFVSSTLPCIAGFALQGESLVAEAGGVKLSLQQQPGLTKLSRKLAASIVASGFLCLFPGNVDEDEERMENMPNINFSDFFRFLSPSQRG